MTEAIEQISGGVKSQKKKKKSDVFIIYERQAKF